jgi:hypothetical protein
MWWAPNVHEPGGRGVERAALDEFVHPDLNGAVSTDRIDAERIWHQASCDAARAWARFGQPCEIRSHLWPFMQASAIVVELDVVISRANVAVVSHLTKVASELVVSDGSARPVSDRTPYKAVVAFVSKVGGIVMLVDAAGPGQGRPSRTPRTLAAPWRSTAVPAPEPPRR